MSDSVDKSLLQVDEALLKPFTLDALYEAVSRLASAPEKRLLREVARSDTGEPRPLTHAKG